MEGDGAVRRTGLTGTGQATTPANGREAPGLNAGDHLLTELEEGLSARVVKTRPGELRGMFAGPPLPGKEEMRERKGQDLGEKLEPKP